MKKFFLALLISISAALNIYGQEVITNYEGYSWGLYNQRTGQWVTEKIYDSAKPLGSWNGSQYFGLQKNGMWGIADGTGKIVSPFVFQELEFALVNGFQIVRIDGSHGVVDCLNHIIIPCTYKEIRFDFTETRCWCDTWDGKSIEYSMEALIKARSEASSAGQAVSNAAELNGNPSTSRYDAPSAQKPTIKILAPAGNSTYTDANVTIRYQASTYDGSAPELSVYVNGLEAEARARPAGTQKGVAAAWDEIELELPRDRDRPCSIILSVKDGQGLTSDNERIVLRYAGDIPKPTLHILAVGVSSYIDESLPDLKSAANDAGDFVSAIRASDLNQYDRLAEPVLLVDREATKRNIERSMEQLVRAVKQDDVVMLFFSGHGSKDDDTWYFMPHDAEAGGPSYSAVGSGLIRSQMNRIKEKKCHVVVFMDACYSGAMYNTKAALRDITFADPGITAFYSSTASQTSAEFKEDDNGIFTKALLEGLRGGARDDDGNIWVENLHNYISGKVREWTGRNQDPIYENPVGNFILYKVQ